MDFANTFGRRAFRRPTTARGRAAPDGGLRGRPNWRQLRRGDRGDDPRGAAVAALSLPARADGARRSERAAGAAQPYELASRLSFLIWSSGPTTRSSMPPGAASSGPDRCRRARRARCSPTRRRASRSPTSTTSGSAPAASTSPTKSSTLFPAFPDAVRDGMKAEPPRSSSTFFGRATTSSRRLLTSPLGVRERRRSRRSTASPPPARPRRRRRWSRSRQPGSRRYPDPGRRSWRCRPTRIRRRRCCAASSCAPS